MSLSRLFHSYRDEPIGRWGETGVPDHLTHPQAELGLSSLMCLCILKCCCMRFNNQDTVSNIITTIYSNVCFSAAKLKCIKYFVVLISFLYFSKTILEKKRIVDIYLLKIFLVFISHHFRPTSGCLAFSCCRILRLYKGAITYDRISTRICSVLKQMIKLAP